MQSLSDQVWSVSDFVAVCNQTLEFAYPFITIRGEISNCKVSKNRWVYFDLKDENSSVRFFGSVFSLSTAIEDGMIVEVQGAPRLHSQFGFSITFQTIKPVGEGSIKRAFDLLRDKLSKEGIFDPDRKRPIPYPPKSIGLVSSSESAAYRDFVKIVSERWPNLEIEIYDVQVQGEAAVEQIVGALDYFNSHSQHDALVVTRGGGSADDLAAFSTEKVTRAVASSRIPTVVAIGHEIDISLAEMAADLRASTPSNAAELIVPDKKQSLMQLKQTSSHIKSLLISKLSDQKNDMVRFKQQASQALYDKMAYEYEKLTYLKSIVVSLHPESVLKRGYAVVRSEGKLVKSAARLTVGQEIDVNIIDGRLKALIKNIELK